MRPSHCTGPMERIAGHRPIGCPDAAHDHQHRAEGDHPQAAVPDPPGRPVGRRRPGGHDGHADHGCHRPGPPSRSDWRPRRPDHGRRPAEQELPGTGVGAQVGPVRPEQMGGQPHPDQRSDGEEQRGADHKVPGAPRPRRADREQDTEHQRPTEVVLLLDGQRPGVLQGARRGELGEVAVPGDDLLPVGYVEQGGQGRVSELGRYQARTPDPGVQRQDDEQEEHGGKETTGPAPPKGDHPAYRPAIGHQDAGDEVPGQDEEHVDAEPPTSEIAEVKGDDGGDGDGPDAVELR